VHYPLDGDQQRMIDHFRTRFEDRCPLHEVRNRAAIKRSLNNQGSVFGEDAEESDQLENYLAIAESLEV
jgi:chromosome partitioning protein